MIVVLLLHVGVFVLFWQHPISLSTTHLFPQVSAVSQLTLLVQVLTSEVEADPKSTSRARCPQDSLAQQRQPYTWYQYVLLYKSNFDKYTIHSLQETIIIATYSYHTSKYTRRATCNHPLAVPAVCGRPSSCSKAAAAVLVALVVDDNPPDEDRLSSSLRPPLPPLSDPPYNDVNSTPGVFC